MSNSRKQNRHFLDDRSIRQGKHNEKDVNRERKFDWKTQLGQKEEDAEDSDSVFIPIEAPEKKNV